MFDEDAFLAAIKASPRDDAPRLVYADWLDEQGRHEQAEIIRVEQAHRRASLKLAELQARLDPEWAAQVFPTFRLVLVKYPWDQKIMVIKLIRELLGCGLKEAKDISESVPVELGPPAPMSRLLAFESRFQDCGATVEARFVTL